MTDKDIRIEAAKLVIQGNGNGVPRVIAEKLGITQEAVAKAMKKLHPFEESGNIQNNNYVYVIVDGNSEIPACYHENGKTKLFLANPF